MNKDELSYILSILLMAGISIGILYLMMGRNLILAVVGFFAVWGFSCKCQK